MAAAAVKKGSEEGHDHVRGSVVFCFEHATYVVVGGETAESVGVARREEFDAKASIGRPMLNGGKDVVRGLEHGGADEKESALGLLGAGGGEGEF